MPKKPSENGNYHPRNLNGLIQKTRQLSFLLIMGTISSCGSNSTEDQPERGLTCVRILDQNDQNDQSITDKCKIEYKINQRILDEDNDYKNETGLNIYPIGEIEACKNGESNKGKGFPVYGKPGHYKIHAQCQPDKESIVNGYMEVDLEKMGDQTYYLNDKKWYNGEGVWLAQKKQNTNETDNRLIGSFCSDKYKFFLDKSHTKIMLNEYLGTSDETWCSQKFDKMSLIQVRVVDFILQCNEEDQNCDPTEGRDLLFSSGHPGEYSNGQPNHLTFTANTDAIPKNQERIVYILLEKEWGKKQRIKIPVHIKGTKE